MAKSEYKLSHIAPPMHTRQHHHRSINIEQGRLRFHKGLKLEQGASRAPGLPSLFNLSPNGTELWTNLTKVRQDKESQELHQKRQFCD